MDYFARAFFTVIRYILPVLSVVTVSFCAVNLLTKKRIRYKTVLLFDGKNEIEIINSENKVGSDKDSDVFIRSANGFHAVILYSDKGYIIRPVNKSAVFVNGHRITKDTAVSSYDNIRIGETQFNIKLKKTGKDKKLPKARDVIIPTASLVLFQLFSAVSLAFANGENKLLIMAVYFSLIVGELIYLNVRKKNSSPEIEILFLYLISIGLSVVSSVGASDLIKAYICFIVGSAVALILEKVLKNLKLVNIFKVPAYLIGVALFMVNAVIGTTYNGSKNWVNIGSFHFQPSEIIKVIFIFICAVTLDKISSKKSMVAFVSFSLISMAVLAYLRDFGTALVYFAVFMTVIFLRLCNIKIILSIILGGSVVAFSAVKFIPYVNARFSSFSHAWENASTTGYQQTRNMVAIGSGGLFGVGSGNGFLRNITASDTDIVFGVVSEEFGLIIALSIAAVFVVFVLFAAKCLSTSTSVYYGMTAAATSVLFISQAFLNIFGSLDMVPFTGVTLPFISNGGSSLISSCILIAFFKAAANRRVIRITSDNSEVEI